MSRQVSVGKLNIRLPKGWQGDPVLLARQVAEQLQQQAANLHSAEQLNLSLQGPFAGSVERVIEQLGGELAAQGAKPGSRRRDK